MSTRGASAHTWWERHWKKILAGIITAIVIPFVMSWTGLMDLRLGGGNPNPPATQAPPDTATSPRTLAADSPVTVVWTGAGDTIEVSWQAIDDPELHHYWAQVYGLDPVVEDYDIGYRFGEELRTTATTNPRAELNDDLAGEGSSQRVPRDQTWKICVTGMRDTPGGVDITPYIIAGTERCSDPFTIP